VREKLQKVLARAGLASRREIERWIAQGRLTVNGAPAHLGQRVGPENRIALDGWPVPLERLAPRGRVLVYHKPEGELCTRRDPQGRPTVFDRLPPLRAGRWILVGRLDVNSSGLLLVTDDGELAHRLMHPSSGIEREYAVRVFGEVPPQALARLTEGVRLEDGPARFESVRFAGGSGANRWYHVVIKEGRQREVRRLWEAVGAQVSRLIRVRYGPVVLPRGLRQGQYRVLEGETLAALYRAAGLLPPAAASAGSAKATKRAAAPHSGPRRRRGAAQAGGGGHEPRQRERSQNDFRRRAKP
jgi:23S rRNA pseudouridine2605 synthase